MNQRADQGRHLTGHEPEGTRPVVVAALVGAVFLGLVLTGIATGWIMHAFAGPAAPRWAEIPSSPGHAGHWIDPPGDLRAAQQREHERLSGYAWVDRSRGIVRVPIERAMELIASERSTTQPAPGRARDE